jgi:hypothetical protein
MSSFRTSGAFARFVTRFALCGVLLAATLPASAQTRQIFLYHETDTFKVDLQGQEQIWKEDIPYKQRVRVLTNLVEFPTAFDSVAERDIVIQFYDHLARRHPEVLEKMRNHGRSPNTWIQSADSRAHYSRATQGSFTYDVVLIDDFSYVPRKNPQAKTPGYTKAMDILGIKL